MEIKKKIKKLFNKNPYRFTHDVRLQNGEVTNDVYVLQKLYKGSKYHTFVHEFKEEELEYLKGALDELLDSRF